MTGDGVEQPTQGTRVRHGDLTGPAEAGGKGRQAEIVERRLRSSGLGWLDVFAISFRYLSGERSYGAEGGRNLGKCSLLLQSDVFTEYGNFFTGFAHNRFCAEVWLANDTNRFG